ncbi:MAG TPA: bifunctional 2-polyprenyl-6-hydroxyphenol methylase/3-demethylubiquinol 3-O-methyltransferase UbiG [Steroidobacteraceae bacterium]
MSARRNVDTGEIAKFEALAQRWWDPKGEFRPLHELNPVRLGFIEEHVALDGMAVLDVGCGGGILSEAMARRGARVLGVDLAQAPLEVAQLHALEAEVALEYRLISAEELVRTAAAQFDVVTCMEMLEHVPEPETVMHALGQLVKPGGHVFVSTINRNLKAFLLAIVGAEYLMRLLPRGTHEYERFLRPSEIVAMARRSGLDLGEIAGIEYQPLAGAFTLSSDASVNYLVHFTRPAANS